MNTILIAIGKTLSFVSKKLGFGHGSTWPGHIALSINKNFVKETLSHTKTHIIFIAGTNGKTTTAKLIATILRTDGKTVFHNASGANLLNGIASTLIQHSSFFGNIEAEFGIFEIDENTLPHALREIAPDYLVILNLFRDQLDRYGEVDSIAKKWGDAIRHLPSKTTLILNADDPQIAYLHKGYKGMVKFFGLDDKSASTTSHQHAVDSIYCLNCGSKLIYKTAYFSHIGDWECKNCGEKRPKLDISNTPSYPLSGIYNRYNPLAAILLSRTIGLNDKIIDSALQKFSPAFGRQEIIEVNGKKIQLFLSKNPTSFNESLRTIEDLGAKHILFVLNDRIPDGRDISWIWDVDFEEYVDKNMNIVISGDRCYDLALRLKYTNPLILNTKYLIQENLGEAIKMALDKTSKNDILYVLSTYSAMLEVRKILTGRKIL